MTVHRMAFVAACCGMLAAAPAAAAESIDPAKRGAEIAARWCSDCHASGASARASDVGPPFPKIARERSADYLRGFLANPHVRGQMPPFDLTRDRIEDLVAYLQSLR
ncbi:hypothetical protein GCM10017083_45770 [Thalassobaculum fulvum]|uniref:Cytochrome c domain-containing protein n=1 Tax=Thalassobaculum fulvum TaxID=1633335 RepID=A0A919CRP8_9PROT|nr:cytochrome c [Thalassobaculum fulvum]GHD60103.1 hypothetical protein GCM10017083_45770 [Thalassobaculum fulvum]